MSRAMYTTGMQLQSHTLTAHNDAAASANKIHDDTVARQYGFRGGLVPGVSVYAYMTYPLVHSFGEAWLTRGTAQVQFAKPIYEGDQVTVTGIVNAVAESEMRFDLASTNAEGVACGVGTATLPTASEPSPDLAEIPVGPRQAPRVPISWDAVVIGQPLPLLTLTVISRTTRSIATPMLMTWRCIAAPGDLCIQASCCGSAIGFSPSILFWGPGSMWPVTLRPIVPVRSVRPWKSAAYLCKNLRKRAMNSWCSMSSYTLLARPCSASSIRVFFVHARANAQRVDNGG